jgi:hypothetical protein
MGYSVSWLAIRGKDPATILDELGLHETGDYQEVPDWRFCGAQLLGGWYLIFANEFGFTESCDLGRLSTNCEIVTCSLEEHVMCSYASGWSHGEWRWSIAHDCQQNDGVLHLETKGELPLAFDSVRERLVAQQNQSQGKKSGVDYIFDVPLEVAKSLTGFKHDEDFPGGDEEAFERLEPDEPPRKWWQFWK